MRRSSLQQWFLSAKKGDDVNLLKLIKVKRASWDIDVRDDKARTALILAAKSGSLASVARLLENGADPNRRSQLGGPAHAAIEARNFEVLQLLLNYGAHLNTKNNRNLTVFEHANKIFGDQKVGYLLESIDAPKLDHIKRPKLSLQGDKEGTSVISAPLPEVTLKEIKHYDADVYADGPYSLYIKGMVDKDDVTIKKYKKNVDEDLVTDLFANEVKILSDLRHPNILLLMSACHGPSPADCCMVLEPVEQFLHKMIYIEQDPFDEDITLGITRDIACGLVYLHQRGFVHCYLGAHSVVIRTDTYKAKICNFEYARVITSKNASAEPISHLEPLYEWMAPEQLRGIAADQQGDVYSFGILVWEIATGKRPFHYITNFKAIIAKKDPRIRRIPAKWIGDIKQLIEDCVLPADKRPTSMQVYEWLDGLTNNRLVHYRPANIVIENLPPLFPKTKAKLDKTNK